MTLEQLSNMLVLHKEYYFNDLHDITSDKSAIYAEQIIRALGISMKENLGDDFYRAYGIIDDHVEEMLSCQTAAKKLFNLVDELKLLR